MKLNPIARLGVLAAMVALAYPAAAAAIPAGTQLHATQTLIRNNGSEPESLDPTARTVRLATLRQVAGRRAAPSEPGAGGTAFLRQPGPGRRHRSLGSARRHAHPP